MRRPEPPLSSRHALALGLLQGPTELLPVSSSGHTTLIPWLAGWPYAELDGHSRKSFELALHAGAGCALAIAMRVELGAVVRRLDRRRAGALALALAPPALAGVTLRGLIERRLGGPRSIVAGLFAGGVAMAVADHFGTASGRSCGDAGPRDGLALGLAQAAALAPGVSRSGAALSAARARGFDREAAHALSWAAAMPVILGASALEALRVRTPRPHEPARTTLALGAGAAFASTLLSARLLAGTRAGARPLLAFSLYRFLLGGVVLRRLRRRRASR